MKFKYKQFVIGFVAASVLTSSVAFAADESLKGVLKNTAKFIVNQVDKTPANNLYNNGKTNVPSSLIYEGTTYVPIRLVSNMLEVPIEWDGKNKTVLVGNSVYSGKYLTDLPPSKIDSTVEIDKSLSVDGQSYNKSLRISTGLENGITYNLNGQYEELTFIFAGGDGASGNLKITDENDKALYESAVPSNSKGYEAKVDLKGALSITISYVSIRSSYSKLLLVNPLLK